ncbi:hypothetical protein BDQ94DRAFT_146081 [Aspergillus welwitschiae]|uniref:Uncharacterized protein n=1 Tax=Aspergillus welwitschiae TaxID=1341132 RepID=A0A3F3PYF9_9EURO|nr:hypothetical protein BDQ94DRAFT_146081 [Aspergillus welwitschiae]RDH31949.1 hypothetical protein BDQ94DRAFT_146081 [Aspergillus welwitschiae]
MVSPARRTSFHSVPPAQKNKACLGLPRSLFRLSCASASSSSAISKQRTCPISDSQPTPIHILNSTDSPIHPLGPRTLNPENSHRPFPRFPALQESWLVFCLLHVTVQHPLHRRIE